MGIWDDQRLFPGAPRAETPLAQMLQGLSGMSAADAAASTGVNRIIPRPSGTTEEALAALLGMTGIPDIQAGVRAMGRGEYLPGFGQAAFGALGLGALGAPVARGAAAVGREALGAVPGVMADTRGAIRAFHGSPYDFDRFDMSKIGTGEGAQAYGHGLYLAGNEDVAKVYRDQVRDTAALDAINRQMSEIADQMWRITKPGTYREFTDPRGHELAAEYDRLMAEKTKPGHMYEASINAEPEQFLDWDKPLSRQSEMAKAQLQEFGLETAPPQFEWRMVSNPFRSEGRPDIADRYTLFVRANDKAPWDQTRSYFEKSKSGGWDIYGQGRYRGALMSDSFEGAGAQSAMREAESMVPRTAGIGPDTTGGQAYRLLSRGQEQQTSEALRDAGIPGIRYLDQGSRGAGEGTHNYVVFDDKLIDIIRKYGLAGLIAGGASIPLAKGR